MVATEKQNELLAIRTLEQHETELGRIMAQYLKRRSDISFSDEDQRLPERTKYRPYEPLSETLNTPERQQ